MQKAVKSKGSDGLNQTIDAEYRQTRSLERPETALLSYRSPLSWTITLSKLNLAGFPMMKNSDEFVQLGKDTIDVIAKSTTALAEGCKEINHYVMAITNKSFVSGFETSKEAFDLKSPSDWVDLHSKWTGELFTAAAGYMAELSRLSTKVLNQAYDPLRSHFTSSVNKAYDN